VAKNYITEFIGTFFLVFTIGMCVTTGQPLAPLAIGSALMVMVYMGGHISGGHYNPAVTLAVFLRGKIAGREAGAYMLMQLCGAIVAALLVFWLTGGKTFAPEPSTEMTKMGAAAAEFVFTFALALVVLNTATATETAGNSYFGLAIGFTVAVGVFAVGGLSGGAFNPAVGSGPAIVRALLAGGPVGQVWYYLVAQFVGGAAAAGVFKMQNPGD